MPRFFFDTVDGSRPWDTQGMVLSDHTAARVQAIIFAGQVMQSQPDVLWDGRDFMVEVRDERGLLLFIITAFATNAPAGGDTK